MRCWRRFCIRETLPDIFGPRWPPARSLRLGERGIPTFLTICFKLHATRPFPNKVGMARRRRPSLAPKAPLYPRRRRFAPDVWDPGGGRRRFLDR